MAPIVPHFLCLSLAVTLACFLVVGSEDLPVYELQARCAAQCLVYDPQGKEYQTVDWGPYSFGSNFYECITPCERAPLGEDCIQLCKNSFQPGTERQNCTASCAFLEEIKTPKTYPNKRFPLPIDSIPEYNSTTETLCWKIPDDIYEKKRYLVYPVSFVIQSATINNQQYGNNLLSTDLQWVAHRPTFFSEVFPHSLLGTVDTSLLYVFRVATFNRFGSSGFSEMSLPVSLANDVECQAIDDNDSYPLAPEYVLYSDYFVTAAGGTLSGNVSWNPPATGVQPSCYQVLITLDSVVPRCSQYNQTARVSSSIKWYTVRGVQAGCNYFVSIVSEPPLLNGDIIDPSSVSSVIMSVPGHKNSIPRDVEVSVMFEPSYQVFCANVSWKRPFVSVSLTGFKVSWGQFYNSFPVAFKAVTIKVDGTRLVDESFSQSTDKLDPGRLYFVEVNAVHFGEIDEPAPRKRFETPGLYPDPPGNVEIEVLDDGVLVSWSEPEEDSVYPPISYTVLWGTRLVEDDETQEISLESDYYGNVSVPNDTLMYMLTLPEGATKYYVQVWAISSNGPGIRSEPIDFWSPLLTTSAPKAGAGAESESGSGSGSGSGDIILYIGIAVAVVVVGVIIGIIAIIKNRRKEVKFEVTTQMGSQEMHNVTDGMNGVVLLKRYVPKEPPDGWEVDPTRINIVELLGEGFFGVVVKAEVVSRAFSSPTTPPQDISFAIEQHRSRSVSTSCSLLSSTSTSYPFGGRKTVVAIKMLKDSYCESAQRDILEEIKMMKRIGSHPHIVNMLGCVTQSVPLMLLVEFVSGGDLLTYLRRQRPDRLLSSVSVPMNEYTPEPKRRNVKSRTRSRSRSQSRDPVDDDEIDDDVFTEKPEKPKKNPLPLTTRLSFQDLTNLARQIALGMNYLGSKGVIHRDLACRNVLVDGSNKQVKVSDFGLARAVYKDAAYVTTKRGFLPLKWMSVEAIFDRVFTTSSDVWSFGVVLWEICTLGGIPYPCVDDDLLATKLREGYRMSRPENCSDELYEIIKRCWHPEPNHRPKFQELSSWLDGLNPLGMRNSSDRVMPWLSASDVDSNMSSPNPSVS